MKTYYMHMINGKPAAYFPKHGICYMNFYGKPNPLSASLKQIRHEQKATVEYRRGLGIKDVGTKYGYRRVMLPDGC